jgi:DNA-binding CsgD family transcriptional regulator
MPEFLGGLRELLELDTTIAFAYRPETEGLSLDWLECAGSIPSATLKFYAGILAANTGRSPGLYDALRPESSQRNSVVSIDTLQSASQQRSTYEGVYKDFGIERQRWESTATSMAWAQQEVFRPMGFGRYHHRVVVCHGATMLGWIGGCQDEKVTERQHQLLLALVPTLRNRLFLEESLRNAPLNSAGLDVALDWLGTPSFLLDRLGRVLRANAQGRFELSRDAHLVDRLLCAITAPARNVEFTVTAVKAPGLPDHYLVRQRAGHASPQAHASAAAEYWSLTPRQGDVLQHVAVGATNKAAAAALGIAEKTVEVHLSAIFARVGVTNRSELIALVSRFQDD